MSAQRKISIRQMELLVEFAESHREIVFGRFPGRPRGARVRRKLWESIADQLNSVADGFTKTPEQWCEYWTELKEEIMYKAGDLRWNALETGDGPNKLAPLNEIEERVLAILGPVAVEGLPGVRLPIEIPSLDDTETPANSAPDAVMSCPSTSKTIPQTSAPNSLSSEPLMEVEPFNVAHTESQAFTSLPSTETQPTDTADFNVHSDEQPEVSREDRQAQRSTLQARRPRSQRQIRRAEGVPRLAYDIEMRRIAAEERHSAALEALVQFMKEIRDDIRSYLHRTG